MFIMTQRIVGWENSNYPLYDYGPSAIGDREIDNLSIGNSQLAIRDCRLPDCPIIDKPRC